MNFKGMRWVVIGMVGILSAVACVQAATDSEIEEALKKYQQQGESMIRGGARVSDANPTKTDPEVLNLRLPAGGAEQASLIAACRKSPAAFFQWVHMSLHGMTPKSWKERGVTDPLPECEAQLAAWEELLGSEPPAVAQKKKLSRTAAAFKKEMAPVVVDFQKYPELKGLQLPDDQVESDALVASARREGFQNGCLLRLYPHGLPQDPYHHLVPDVDQSKNPGDACIMVLYTLHQISGEAELRANGQLRS